MVIKNMNWVDVENGFIDRNIFFDEEIYKQELEQVFARFFRGGSALERHVPGTGIGLDIVSTIVAAHGGRVTVQSKLGEGSAFTVELPRQEA